MEEVGVGMTITDHPLHRSQRGGLPHWALALGHNEKALFRVRSNDPERRHTAEPEFFHALPCQPVFLTTASEGPVPVPNQAADKGTQGWSIARLPVVLKMSLEDGADVETLLRNGLVHPAAKFLFEIFELAPHALLVELPKHDEFPLARPVAAMGKAEKRKGFRFPLPTSTPVVHCNTPKLNKPCLLRVYVQVEVCLRPGGQRIQKLLGIRLVLEPPDDVIGITHDDHAPVCMLLSPFASPQVEGVVKVDVSQKRANTCPLRGTFFYGYSPAFLQYACIEPFLDVAHYPLVGNPVPEKLHEPFVVNGIVESTIAYVEHPVHVPGSDSYRQGVLGHMGTSAWPESIGEPKKVGLIDYLQHLDGRSLHYLVFQPPHSQGAGPSFGFWDVRAHDRLCSVRPALEPIGEVSEVILKVLAIGLPPHSVYPRRSLSLEPVVGFSQTFHVVDVMPERRELTPFISNRFLSYPFECVLQILPVLRPGSGALARVPLGQLPSLDLLSWWSSGLPPIAQRLARYHGAVRLPICIHHWRAPFGFPMRTTLTLTCLARARTSRFPYEVRERMHRAFDRTWLAGNLRYRFPRCGLPRPPNGSGSESGSFHSRLNTGFASSPVNALPTSLPMPVHDVGPLWVATPSTSRTFIFKTSPV